MTQSSDILVVGAGIVGLTAALAMSKQGYTVALIDSGSMQIDNALSISRVYAINHASEALFKKLELWPFLDCQRLSPYQHMHVWDSQSAACIDFDARDIAASNLGHIIEEIVLKQALFQAISQQASIRLFTNCSIDDIQESSQSIRVFSKEKAWEGRLFMLADGANSPSRQKLKVALNTWSYQQHAIVANVSIEKPHLKTAFQVFNPDGPLAFLPMVDKHQCSIVWSTDTARSNQLMSLDEAAFNEELTKSFAKRLGQVQVNSARHQFPLQMRHVKEYTGNRWMLLGDCAHTIHPLAGLGLNIGLADIRSWLNCLQDKNQADFTKRQLKSYQRERKQAVWQMILLMEGFKRIFSHSFAPTVLLRGLGLRLCNQLTPLKRLCIHHATGLKDFI